MSAEETKKRTESAAKAEAADQSKSGAMAEKEREAIKAHDLAPLQEGPSNGEAGNIDLLLDVSVPITAQLGATEMRIRDVLRLVPGSIVELDKLAGDPVDLFVRGKLIAQGEVVVVDESFGIRVTKIVTPNERMENLGISA
jgi:flagellar motor switch protein FliN/FliY